MEHDAALYPLRNRYPSTFDDEISTEVIAREHVLPLALCYAISARAEVLIQQYSCEWMEELSDDSIWREHIAGSISISYQDPERGHGFGTGYVFDCS